MKIRSLYLASSLLYLSRFIADAQVPPERTAGNLFMYTTANSAVTNSANSTAQYTRFTAMEDTVASSISINLNTVAAGTHNVTIGLQADDGSGRPSGVFLASGALDAVTGWNTVNFAGTALEVGKMYHVVVTANTGAVSWRHLNGVVPSVASNGYYDSGLARGAISNNVPGAPTNSTAVVFHVGTSGTYHHGSVYASALLTNAAFASNGNVPAQQFVFNALDTGSFLDSVTVRLNIGSTLPTSGLRVVLLNDQDNILGDAYLDHTLFATGTSSYTAMFENAIGLVDGESYRLALYSQGSASNSIRWAYMSTDSASFADASYQGTEGHAFSYLNNSLTSIVSTNFNSDYVFSYTTTLIPEPGSIVLLGLGFAGVLWAKRRQK